jgi:hypothetical protein
MKTPVKTGVFIYSRIPRHSEKPLGSLRVRRRDCIVRHSSLFQGGARGGAVLVEIRLSAIDISVEQ